MQLLLLFILEDGWRLLSAPSLCDVVVAQKNAGNCCPHQSETRIQGRSRIRSVWAWVITLSHILQKLIFILYYGCICLSALPVVWKINQPKTSMVLMISFHINVMLRNILWLEWIFWVNYFTCQNLVPVYSKQMTDNIVSAVLAQVLSHHCIYMALLIILTIKNYILNICTDLCAYVCLCIK